MKRRNFFELLAAIAAGSMLPKVGLTEYPKKELVRTNEVPKVDAIGTRFNQDKWLKQTSVNEGQFVLSYDNIVVATGSDATVSMNREMIEISTREDIAIGYPVYEAGAYSEKVELITRDFNSTLIDRAMCEDLQLDFLFKGKKVKASGIGYLTEISIVHDVFEGNHLEGTLCILGKMKTIFG